MDIVDFINLNDPSFNLNDQIIGHIKHIIYIDDFHILNKHLCTYFWFDSAFNYNCISKKYNNITKAFINKFIGLFCPQQSEKLFEIYYFFFGRLEWVVPQYYRYTSLLFIVIILCHCPEFNMEIKKILLQFLAIDFPDENCNNIDRFAIDSRTEIYQKIALYEIMNEKHNLDVIVLKNNIYSLIK